MKKSTTNRSDSYLALVGSIFSEYRVPPVPKRDKNGRLTRPSSTAIKQRVHQRDGWCCVICGFSSVIEMHHIDPYANGGSNKMENLITLCPNHHAMADSGELSSSVLHGYFAISDASSEESDDEDLSDILPGLSTGAFVAPRRRRVN